MGRRRRNKARLSKEEWEQQMEAIDRHDEEQMRNRQQHSTANAAPKEESTAPNVSDAVRSKQDTAEADSKYRSPRISKEAPDSNRTHERALSSSRHDETGSRSKNRSKPRMQFSSDEDSGEGSLGISSPKRRYKRSKRSSSFSESSGEESPLQKRYGNSKEAKDHSVRDKSYRRHRKSPPKHKTTDDEVLSIDSWKGKPSAKRSASKTKKDSMSFARRNSSSSASSIDSPSTPRDMRRRRDQTGRSRIDHTSFDETTNNRKKAFSPSEPISMPPQEPAPLSAQNDLESDSDASWDLMAIKRKSDMALNQGTKQQTKKSEPSVKSDQEQRKNLKRSDLSHSFSDDDQDQRERDDSVYHRKRETRKRPATDDEHSDYSDERMSKRVKEPSQSRRRKRSSRRAESSSDERSVLGSDDDKYEKSSSTRHQRDTKPASPATPNNDPIFTAVAVANPGSKSFVDDDDDGFMSDCDPLPSPSTKKSAKGNDTSRYGRKGSISKRKSKETGKGQHFQPESVFDDGDIQYEVDRGGSPSDLHPYFEDPKFGPYEPMEPLVLSGDQDGDSVQVPASLNRYLAPFQKEGIRFMYDCLARKSGVILGDEMGCGKTVQVIALLCALFQKTGTRKDFLDIQERNSIVREKLRQVRIQKDRALHMGEVFNDDLADWKTSLSLSPWNPVMIVVPPTIVDTWKNAFKMFSYFSVSFYSSKTKLKAIESVLHGSAEVLVVPKSAFQAESHLRELERVEWRLIVIDEFHNFKNHKGKISNHLRLLKEMHGPLVLGMTGTLMQNNHTELWNLVDLVETNYFGSRDQFIETIERPIKLGRTKGANQSAQARSEVAKTEFRKALNKIYIKRSKNDVLKGQLPEKNEEFILCDLSPLQKEVYKHVIQLPDFENVRYGSRPCDCGVNQNFFRQLSKLKGIAERLEFMRHNKSRVVKQSKCCKTLPLNPRYNEGYYEDGVPKIDPDAAIWRTLDSHCTNADAAENGCERCPWCCTLPCLTKLNKLSSHLGLLQAKKTTEAIGSPTYITYVKDREFAKVALAAVVDRLPGKDFDRNDGIMDDHFNLSGKLRVLNNLLQQEYNEGSKVLLFSHSTQSLDLIENWLRSRGSFEYSRMDGGTQVSKRQQLVDEFNNTDHIFLFLLSIKATGLGLNLTSANRVIMYDVSWNPSWELQAQDRAYRIGQKRNVRVVRLISKGTVEEMIYLRQIYKEHLKQDTLEEDDNGEAPRVFRGVQGDKYRKGELFGTENLFRFKEHGSFLQDIYNVGSNPRNRGKSDSSGFEIHDSGKVSEVLLGMTDEQKERVDNDDDLVAIKSSPEAVSNVQSARPQESEPAPDPAPAPDFALNHKDLFRSDRGGAAIKPGEDGFDEEMGGQTQAAYDVFENVKDDLSDEEEEDDEEDNGNENGTSKGNCGDLASKVKQETRENTIKTEPSNLKVEPDNGEMNVKTEPTPDPVVSGRQTILPDPVASSRQTVAPDPVSSSRQSTAPMTYTRTNSAEDIVPDAIPSTVTSSSSLSHERFNSNQAQQASPEQKLESDPAPPVSENRTRSESPIESRGNIIPRKANGTKRKVLLMGCNNIGGAKTKFSAADLGRPEYGKKKKKKKKNQGESG